MVTVFYAETHRKLKNILEKTGDSFLSGTLIENLKIS